MSVESASCVSYHCPADGRDYEEEQQQKQQQQQHPEVAENKATAASMASDIADDISATAAIATAAAAAVAAAAAATATTSTSESPPIPTSAVSDIDKATTTVTEEQSEVVRRAEINLAKPNKEAAPTTTITPQDIAEQQPATNQINEDAAEHGQQHQQLQQLPTSHNWSPVEWPRRSRTPPAPQNSPVGFGLAAATSPPTVPPALAPLLQQLPVSSKRNVTAKSRNSNSSNCNNNNNNNNRIIECDLIPSKKSKRKANKKQTEAEHVEAAEPTVREQIRDIMPLPGFLQAFGSTEIGRFSERFLQTSESLVERLAEEYSHASSSSNNNSNASGYYDATPSGMNAYWPSYEEQQSVGYQSQQMSRSRMRAQGYPYPEVYPAYERYSYAAYNAGRSRYGEIRCNGY